MSNSTYRITVQKINRLETIAANLPTYQVHFNSERYGWLNAPYIASKLNGAKEYFAARENLAESIENQAPALSAARLRLKKITSATTYFINGYLKINSNDLLERLAVVDSQVWSSRATTLLHALTTSDLTNPDYQSHYVNFELLKTDLQSALDDFERLKADSESKETTLETQKQEFLAREDSIDDLYHDITNAIDGALHENREILLKIMPWRERKTTTQPLGLTAALAALPDLAGRASSGNIEINGTRTVASETVTGEFVVATEELKPVDFVAVAEGGFLSEAVNLAISAVRFEGGRLQFDLNIPNDSNWNGASVTVSSLIEPKKVVARANVN